ncbi:MAG: hypothetical protein NTY75_01430 [Candidatus Shapirobacteria bacterium]|nr:hypothetical protein [Candidatus Shapirobacteria bacterium]
MKQTIAGLIVLYFLVASPVDAITLGVVRRVSTPTPTPVPTKALLQIVPRGSLKLINTVVPTVKPTETIAPTKTVTPTNAVTVTETPAPTLQPTVDLSPTVEVTAINDGDQDNLTIWFLAATIGLLLIIVIAQAWPKKENED